MQGDVIDPDSLNYASATYPAYMQDEDGKINVYPVAADNSGKDAYKVYYVNNTPQNSSGTALDEDHSDLKYFPQDLEHLVVLYTAYNLAYNFGSYYALDEDEVIASSWVAIGNTLKDRYDQAFDIHKRQQQRQR